MLPKMSTLRSRSKTALSLPLDELEEHVGVLGGGAEYVLVGAVIEDGAGP